MANKWYFPDLSLTELKNALLHKIAGNPGSPSTAQVWYDTVADRFKGRVAGATKTFAHTDEVGAGVTFDSPGSSAVGDTVGAGSDTDAARADHRHGREAFAAPTAQTSFGGSSATGSATTVPHSDHAHGTPAHDASAHSAIKLSDLAVPTADVSLNSHKLTAVTTGTADSDGANVGQMNALLAGLTNKASVRAASTANVVIASALENGDSLDGVTLATGDRVLLPYQTTGSENGIYIVVASGAASRATDADISAEVKAGLYVFVSEGTVNGNKGFQLFTNDPITLGSTSLDFQIVSAAGQITAGAGLTKTGDTMDVGATTGITVAADTVGIDKTKVPVFRSADVGATTTTSFTITNGGFFATAGPISVQVWLKSTGAREYPDIIVDPSTADITVDFGVSVDGSLYAYNATGKAA